MRETARDEIGWDVKRPNVGDRIRCTARPDGERVLGIGHPGAERWLLGGTVGEVTRIIPGYPRHLCPDHDDDPDCVCGGAEYGDGWVDEDSASPVVTYPAEGGEGVVERCVSPEDEGESWERVS